jgi:hypothetical protein
LACLLFFSFLSVLHAPVARSTFKDGVINDPEYGLQWVPAPLRVMSHYEAQEYVLNLSIAGGRWRLPTVEELKSIYDKSQPGGAYPFFNASNKWIWSSKVDESNPSSAVHNLKINYIRELRFKSGDFLHYIFNYLGSVGQKNFHSLEQNPQFF